MEYYYLLEEKANKNLSFNELSKNQDVCVLNILCYSIENDAKYPFLQFMMEKIPYCNITEEQFVLPCVFMRNNSRTIEDLVLEKIKINLKLIGCDSNLVIEDMFKGVLIADDCGTPYVLVNITGIDVCGLNLSRQTTTWFVLPSEIINSKKICNINIDSDVVNFFTEYPQVSILQNKETKASYILPDAVYTGGEMKQVEFHSIFGNRKKKVYNCGEYYYFYRVFGEAVRDGGWLREGSSNKIGDRVVAKENGKYFNGGINRYALFVEGKIYLESNRVFSLTDWDIDAFYGEPCVIICYSGEYDINPDMLVKNYDSFVPLSYHKLDTYSLGDEYIETNKKKYMIA